LPRAPTGALRLACCVQLAESHIKPKRSTLCTRANQRFWRSPRLPPPLCCSRRVAAHSDLAVASRQDACTAFFCVPCVANALSGPSSTSAAPSYEDDASVGALLLGFPSEAQVVRE
jgi:hypothetical protein